MRSITRLLLLALMLATQSCGIYSFSGTNLSKDVNTISIQNLTNTSGGGPPSITQTFSEKIRDYFQRNTRLGQSAQSGDLQLEGNIITYQLAPLPPSANDVASQMRLTIGIRFNYVNTKDDTQNFEETLSFFADYDASQSLPAVESQLIETISDQIIIQLFNRSVANW